ncbi:MAG: hypothetical protein ABI175_05350 [Polyangiales bacterium]
MRNAIQLSLSISFALALALTNGCDKSSTVDTSKSDKGSSKSGPTSGDNVKSTGGGPATDEKGGVAVPSDPLVDYPSVFASCDASKEAGECIEYAEVGFTEDSIKSLCESIKGTWAKGKNCPKDGKVAACNVAEGKNRHVYYKAYFELMKMEDLESLCSSALLGTWGEFPKGK